TFLRPQPPDPSPYSRPGFRPSAGQDPGDVIIGNVLPRGVGRIDVEEIDLPNGSRRLRRIQKVCLGGLGSFDGKLGNDLEGSTRIWLPTLHVRRIDSGRIRDSVSAFNDRGQQ